MITSPDPSPALIIFLRRPEAGKVKTRIALTEGDEVALRIYEELTSITFQLARAMDLPVYLYYDPAPPAVEERIRGMAYKTQATGNLGFKMEMAFREVLDHHPAAILIGSDCPLITTGLIRESVALLRDHDVVIGPSEDGGYYLIACCKMHPFLFHDVPWGTANVLSETKQRIREARLRSAWLDPLFDIDTAADWDRYTRIRADRH